MSEERTTPDWERVEADYRAGLLSLREIAAKDGHVTEGAIRKRAKRDLWTRSIVERIPRQRSVVLKAPIAPSGAQAGFVYAIFIDAGGERLFKIGMARNFNDRIGSHQTSSPFDLHVACCYYVGDMRHEERHLHGYFAAKHVRGEWFRLSAEDVALMASRGALI